MTKDNLVSNERFMHIDIPPRDLQEIHKLLSNYLEYWNPTGESGRKLRDINERLWRALNGYGYTAPPDPEVEVSRTVDKAKMQFIGPFDKGFYELLKKASNEELSALYHNGGYATSDIWGKVAQLMLERVCFERNYDPWTKKTTQNKEN